MSRRILGDACAYIRKQGDAKAIYRKIGVAFIDDQDRISLKLDTLPIPGDGWVGWVNIFPSEKAARTSPQDRDQYQDMDPF